MNTDEEQLRLCHSSKENTGARKVGRKRGVTDTHTEDLTGDGTGRGKKQFR